MTGRLLLILAAILGFGLSLSACGPQRPHREPCPAGELCLEYGNGPDPQTLDPQLAQTTNEAAILREVFEGMYTDGPQGEPEFGVAAGAPQVSADGLVWTFHLRAEQWSDGQPLTANDFVFAYKRMLDPKTASPYAYLLYVLKNAEPINDGKASPDTLGAKAIDDATLQLTLEHPASYLPQLLKHQAYFPIPAHLVQRVGDAWKNPGTMVSNGAYTLVSWRLGDHVTIARNPLYRKNPLDPDAAPLCFARVDFFPTIDAVTAERRVLSGELDLNNSIVANRVRRLLSTPASKGYVHTHAYLGTYYLALNPHDVPALRLPAVRWAISMAIDRDFIAYKVLGAGFRPAVSFVPHGVAGYLAADAPHPQAAWANLPLDRRQALARQMLTIVGYGPDHPLELELKTVDGGSNAVAQAIQSDLKSVGVNIRLRLEDGSVHYQSLNLRDFQLGTAGWIADYNDPMTFLGLLQSSAGQQNYGDYNNPRFDALLKQSDNEPDAGKRAALLAQAEQMAMDDANLVPLYTPINSSLVNPHITGWVDNDADIHPIRYLCRHDAGPQGGQ